MSTYTPASAEPEYYFFHNFSLNVISLFLLGFFKFNKQSALNFFKLHAFCKVLKCTAIKWRHDKNRWRKNADVKYRKGHLRCLLLNSGNFPIYQTKKKLIQYTENYISFILS